MRRSWFALVLVLTGARVAGAHVAPSVDDNNRYLKLTAAPDQVRLAYTVFFGERPGAQLRPGLDGDRDGMVSDAEAQAFGVKLGAEVAPALALELDGRAVGVSWSTIAVGMGSPGVRGGSFSVDLIATVCVTGDRHALRLRDRFRVDRPGETEVRLEADAGAALEVARVGPADDASRLYKFVGAGGPLADDGVELTWTVKAPGSGSCAAPAVEKRAVPASLVIGSAAVLGFLFAGIVTLVRRRRAQRG
jgi:hypothetical protein